MRHPEANARQISVPETSVSLSGLVRPGAPAAGRRGGEQAPRGGRRAPSGGGRASRVAAPRTAASEPELPPGQYVPAGWPVLHYGPVPTFHPDTWDLRVLGATESGSEHRWSWDELGSLPRCQVVADFHCVTKFTVPGIAWEGIAAAELLRVQRQPGDR
jgi:DMSO/TMAO reductase YedYZ molybdopterin-dependent catalytic subunit